MHHPNQNTWVRPIYLVGYILYCLTLEVIVLSKDGIWHLYILIDVLFKIIADTVFVYSSIQNP